ncbi:metallophosphoesterase family protein [Pseudorhodoferax sp.]|uniref:metallophosphoesterase family protein n=1 Tax=Pseudorhodoferax sp. TaxID=1993553 RepID=UPI002DD6B49B|nr:DNA repair exonuclease [Pseudorhodoferax sp.]
MRFLHAADIHLDSPLRGLSAYPDAPAAQLRGATRAAFRQLIGTAIDERVDFVVIAGDLYDGDWPDFNTGLFFCAEMGRLQRAGIAAYVLYGNHDAESHMTRALRLPDNVFRFSAQACQTHVIEPLKVALHGRSFKVRDTTENLVRGYAEPLRGYFNIGVLHTALQGGYGEHAAYAPCTLEELHAKGYDYWALGHVHEYRLWQGPSTVCFPGNLQGRSIRETGPRGAVLVTVDDVGHPPRVERLVGDVLRWEHLAVDVSACTTLEAVGLATGRQLAGLLQADAQVPRALRVTLQGTSPLHGELFQREAELRAHVLAEMAALGPERLWLEKVRLATRPLQGSDAGPADGAGRTLGTDALAELATLLAEARQDEALLAELRNDIGQMLAKAPPELLAELPALRQAHAGELGPVFDAVVPSLLARLAREG